MKIIEKKYIHLPLLLHYVLKRSPVKLFRNIIYNSAILVRLFHVTLAPYVRGFATLTARSILAFAVAKMSPQFTVEI